MRSKTTALPQPEALSSDPCRHTSLAFDRRCYEPTQWQPVLNYARNHAATNDIIEHSPHETCPRLNEGIAVNSTDPCNVPVTSKSASTILASTVVWAETVLVDALYKMVASTKRYPQTRRPATSIRRHFLPVDVRDFVDSIMVVASHQNRPKTPRRVKRRSTPGQTTDRSPGGHAHQGT